MADDALAISKMTAGPALLPTDLIERTVLSATITISATTISAQASDNSINDSGNGFLAAGFAAGMNVNLSGFAGDDANNIFSATILTAAAGKLTFGADGDVIADDAAGELVTVTAWETHRASISDITGQTTQGNVLLDGGGVSFEGDFDFHVSAASYLIQGAPYTSPATDVTLSAADPSDGRFDIIAVDNTGAVVVIEGTPAPNPEQPDVDAETQLQLTFIYVPAGATEAEVTNEDMYLEHAEWTFATNAGGAIDADSTANPHTGTKAIKGTAVAAGDHFTLTKPSGTIDPANYNALRFWIYPDATWPSAKNIKVFCMNGGVQVGVQVPVKEATYGFATGTAAYQSIVIPIEDFTLAGQVFNKVRFRTAGGGAAIGFSIDDVVLQAGVASGGESFTGMKFIGDHSNAVAYSAQQVVRSGGRLYVATTANQNSAPVANDGNANWKDIGITLPFSTDGTFAADSDTLLPTQKATKTYVDAKVAGLSWKIAVRVATTANLSISTDLENGDTVDGVTVATGDRVLVKNQSTGSQNGIYIVPASGAATRATDADSGAELVNATVYVSEGTANADTQWTCSTNAPITVGSTSLAFVQFTSGGGTVTTTGSPANGSLAKFSGATSVTNGDLSGDVNTSGTLASTIANNAVTYAKMQDVSATARIIGRKTAGSGDPEEMTLSETLDLIGSAAQGDILYRGSSGWARLAAGTSGQLLKTLGAGANPAWANVSGVGGGMTFVNASVVSGGATNNITVSGLDLAADGSYYVVIVIKNVSVSTATLSVFFNGDTTATNYRANIDTGSYQPANNANIDGLAASGASSYVGKLLPGLAFGPKFLYELARTDSASSFLMRNGGVGWTVGFANVTSITLNSSVAASLDNGSYVAVWKIN